MLFFHLLLRFFPAPNCAASCALNKTMCLTLFPGLKATCANRDLTLQFAKLAFANPGPHMNCKNGSVWPDWAVIKQQLYLLDARCKKSLLLKSESQNKISSFALKKDTRCPFPLLFPPGDSQTVYLFIEMSAVRWDEMNHAKSLSISDRLLSRSDIDPGTFYCRKAMQISKEFLKILLVSG